MESNTPKDLANRARLTVVETVYHQHPTWEATSEESRYGIWLESLETPYRRPFPVSEKWVQLDCGWLGGDGIESMIGLIVLSNPSPIYTTMPSQEQQEEEESRVIEVGWLSCHTPMIVPQSPDDPIIVHTGPEVIALLRRGRSMRLEPYNCNRIYLRCSKGTAVCNVLALPK